MFYFLSHNFAFKLPSSRNSARNVLGINVKLQCVGGQCYCGHELLLGAKSLAGCDMRCSGNPGQMCGGFWTMSLYVQG